MEQLPRSYCRGAVVEEQRSGVAVKRLVEHLQLNPTDHLLDVCTGTGCVALTAGFSQPE